MSLSIRIRAKNLSSSRIIPVRDNYTINFFNFSAIGGSKQARITIESNDLPSLLTYLQLLRNPIEIVSEAGVTLWNGYISETLLNYGAISIGLSLNEMANTIGVEFSYVAAGSQTVGERMTTTYATDATSTSIYGIKELLISKSGMSTEQANSLRDIELASRKYPVPISKINGQGENNSITLECYGWFNTLDWRTCVNNSTTSVETTTQIRDIITNTGQFFNTVFIINPSGISSSQYKAGDKTCLEEITTMLETGTSNGKRLLIKTDEKRNVRIYAEPSYDIKTTYQFTNDGILLTPQGTPIIPYSAPVGVYARMRDIGQYFMGIQRIVDPSLVFIEELEYGSSPNDIRFTLKNALGLGSLGIIRI